MSLTKLEENLSIIENLPDAPTMESTELKQKFDEGSIKIKDYINEILTVEIDNIVTQIKKDISNKILEDNKKKYYVGKLIFDTKNVNPATYLGFGTWQLWGSGRVPVGVDTSQTEFNTVEKTGGEKTHKLTVAELASHTHTFTGKAHTHTLNNHTHNYAKVNSATEGHTLTVGEIPAHSHISPYDLRKNATSFGDSYSIALCTGGSIKTNNLPVADTGNSNSHSHNIKTTSVNTGGNSGNTSSTIQGGTNSNTGSDTAHNNLQPYITCYIWKRVS